MEHVLAALTPSNALVCRVCLHTGLRVGDVLALQPQQIKRNFWVTESKTKKRRQVGLTKELITEMLGQAGKHWVFAGRDTDKHRTRQAVWWDVKRAAVAFRLPQNVGVHSCRKIYAVELMAQYGDIKRVQKALNHEEQSTTLLYAMAAQLLEVKRRRRGR